MNSEPVLNVSARVIIIRADWPQLVSANWTQARKHHLSTMFADEVFNISGYGELPSKRLKNKN